VLLWSFLFIPSISAVDHCCQRCFFQDWMPFGASYALLRALLLQLPLGMHHFVLDNSQQACSLFFKYSRSPLLFRGTDSKQRLYCFITKLLFVDTRMVHCFKCCCRTELWDSIVSFPSC
jgi:hypothetical protein